MNFILFDGPERDYLLPFTYTRPICEIRTGILTIREKWELFLNAQVSFYTQDYLSGKFPIRKESINILINGSIIPDVFLVEQILKLKPGEQLENNNDIIALCLQGNEVEEFTSIRLKIIPYNNSIKKVHRLWDIYANNHQNIKDDFELLTKGKKSQKLSRTNFIIGDETLIFLEKGAKVEFAFLNTTDGPIYIGKDAVVMEGAKIRGPFSLGDHSQVKLDAKIYTGTTIGPYCKVGGEISNSVIFGYSNKGHDGFLGNSVLGEWCNIGADTNVSNLKNTYEFVKLYSYVEKKFVNTGQQFCGLMLGDHSKTGINTMFNTGTVVGVNVNIFGEGFPRNFIPSFSWGGKHGFSVYKPEKAFQVAKAVMKRRNIDFNAVEKAILQEIYNQTYNSN